MVRGVAQIRCSAVQNVWPKSAPNFGAPNGVMSFSVMFIMGKAVTPLLGQKNVPKIQRFLASKMLHIGGGKRYKPPRPPLTWKQVTPLFDPKSLKLFGSKSGVTKLKKMGTTFFAKSGSIFDSTFCQLGDPTSGPLVGSKKWGHFGQPRSLSCR